MNFLQRLLGKSTNVPLFSHQELMTAEVCPNCWGRGEYDGQFVEFVKDTTKANINHDKGKQKAFIQQFVETHVSGIRLQIDGLKKACKRCRKVY